MLGDVGGGILQLFGGVGGAKDLREGESLEEEGGVFVGVGKDDDNGAFDEQCPNEPAQLEGSFSLRR